MRSHSRSCSLVLVLVAALTTTALAQGEPPEGLRLVLPAEIPAAPGRECNLYFDNVVLALNLANYAFDVECAKGVQQSDRWTFIPTEEDVGEHALSLRVFDGANELVIEGQTTVRVVPSTAGDGQEVSCLLVGDSLTHASYYSEELLRLFGADEHAGIRLIGTHQPREDEPANRHEGYGGWTAQRFATQFVAQPEPGSHSVRSSPFVYAEDGKPTLNVQRYLQENNAGGGPDFLTFALGCNDTFSRTDDTIDEAIDVMFDALDLLIAQFREVRADTKIGLVMLVPPAASQDAFGSNYRCGQIRWQYRRNQHRVVERLLQTYGGREAEQLYLIPAHLNLDTVHNYPGRAAPANTRTETTVFRQSNGVHPAPAGYYQMADSIYCWIKACLAAPGGE